MVIPINERLLSGRKLYISQNGTGGPVIFCGMYPHRGNEVEHLRESLMEIAPGQNFMLVFKSTAVFAGTIPSILL